MIAKSKQVSRYLYAGTCYVLIPSGTDVEARATMHIGLNRDPYFALHSSCAVA